MENAYPSVITYGCDSSPFMGAKAELQKNFAVKGKFAPPNQKLVGVDANGDPKTKMN